MCDSKVIMFFVVIRNPIVFQKKNSLICFEKLGKCFLKVTVTLQTHAKIQATSIYVEILNIL